MTASRKFEQVPWENQNSDFSTISRKDTVCKGKMELAFAAWTALPVRRLGPADREEVSLGGCRASDGGSSWGGATRRFLSTWQPEGTRATGEISGRTAVGTAALGETEKRFHVGNQEWPSEQT